MALVFISVIGPFIWDRVITAIFAPNIFGAMWSEAKQTKPSDLVPVLKTALKVGVVVGLLVMAQNSADEQMAAKPVKGLGRHSGL